MDSRALSLLLTFAILTSGCTFFRETLGIGPKKPRVVLHEVKIDGISLTKIDLKVLLKVHNDNGFDLTFEKMKYNIFTELDDQQVQLATGTYNDSVTIKEKSVKMVELPFAIDAMNLIEVFKRLTSTRETIVTTMQAVAEFVTPFGNIDVDFQDQKKIMGPGS